MHSEKYAIFSGQVSCYEKVLYDIFMQVFQSKCSSAGLFSTRNIGVCLLAVFAKQANLNCKEGFFGAVHTPSKMEGINKCPYLRTKRAKEEKGSLFQVKRFI